jgi:methyl-accepting chemotaxis protein
MAKRKTFFTIFPKSFITMLIVAIIPLVSWWSFNYIKAQTQLEENLEQNLVQTLEAVATKVDDWVDMNLRSSHQNALLPEVVSMDPIAMVPILKSIQDSYEWLYLVHVMDKDGHQTARSDGESGFNADGSKKKDSYRSDRQYFRQAMLANREYGQEVLISRTTGNPGLVLSIPIKDATGRTLGILSRSAHLARVSQAVTDVKVGRTGFAFLVDESGKVIAHGNPERVSEALQDFSNHPAVKAGFFRGDTTFTENDSKVVARMKRVGLNWTLVVQQNYDEAFAPLQEATWNALIALSVTILMVALAAFLFSRRLVNPIRELTAVADDYSRGKLNAAIPGVGRGDEIGALAQSIERMGTSIKMAFKEINR